MLAFIVVQGLWLGRYMEDPAGNKSEENS
jgi:hypothetical protein